MSALQKLSVYNLAVCALFFITWGTLYTLFGMHAAMPGFSLLALLAFGMVFTGGGRKKVLHDERTSQINDRATLAGLRAFMLFYTVYTAVIFFFLNYESIARELYLTLFMFGAVVFITIHSAAALLMESADTPGAPGIVEAFRGLSRFRKTNILTVLSYSVLIAVFAVNFPLDEPFTAGMSLTVIFFVVFLLGGIKRGQPHMIPADERAFERARSLSRRMLPVLLGGPLGMTWGVGRVWGNVGAGHYVFAAFLAVCAAMLVQVVASIVFAGKENGNEPGGTV